MNRREILEHALQAVTVDRAATHGDAQSSFALIAALWSDLTGARITPDRVALMLAALKIVRAWGNPGHADNWVDLAGYAACGGEVAPEGGPGPAPGAEDTPEFLAMVADEVPAPRDPWREKHLRAFGRLPEGGE